MLILLLVLLLRLLLLRLLYLLDVVNGIPDSIRRCRWQIGVTLLASSSCILILITTRLRRRIGIVLKVLRIGGCLRGSLLLVVSRRVEQIICVAGQLMDWMQWGYGDSPGLAQGTEGQREIGQSHGRAKYASALSWQTKDSSDKLDPDAHATSSRTDQRTEIDGARSRN